MDNGYEVKENNHLPYWLVAWNCFVCGLIFLLLLPIIVPFVIANVFTRGAARRWLFKMCQKHITNKPSDIQFMSVDGTTPWLERWSILPRNDYFALYMHCFHSPDKITHDHPYTWNASWLLNGWYQEGIPGKGRFKRPEGTFALRFGASKHIVLLNKDPSEPAGYSKVWTWFMTGPRLRVWGFDCPDHRPETTSVTRWTPWFIATGVKPEDGAKFAKNPNPPVCPQ